MVRVNIKMAMDTFKDDAAKNDALAEFQAHGLKVQGVRKHLPYISGEIDSERIQELESLASVDRVDIDKVVKKMGET